MSPASRGRKGKQNKKSTRRPALPYAVAAPDECDCPACSGADFDPQRLIDELIAGAADLVGSEDPLDAEVVGATFMSIGAVAGEEEFEEALVGGFIPEFEARASSQALAVLLAIGSVAQGRAGKAASVAADRLVEAGVARPGLPPSPQAAQGERGDSHSRRASSGRGRLGLLSDRSGTRQAETVWFVFAREQHDRDRDPGGGARIVTHG